MTDPTGGGADGSGEIGRGHIVIDVQDKTAAGLKQLDSNINASTGNARRQIQSTAQIARNAVSIVTRSVGTSVTSTVLEPIISIGEAFVRSAEDAEVSGNRIDKAFKLMQIGGAGLIGAGASLTLLGAREKQSFDQLSNAIDNLGLSTSDYQERIEEVVSQEEKLGRTSISTMQALQLLTSATHDPTEALNDMQEVSDLAASRQISLASAARQVAITIGGGGRLLNQYNIQTIKNADGTRNYAAMNAELAEVLNGQAAAAMDNWGGKLRVAGVEIEDFLAKFGQKWGPTITEAGVGLTLFGTIMEAIRTKRMKALLETTGEQTAAIEEQTAVTKEGSAASIEAVTAQTEAIDRLTAAYERQAAMAEAAGAASASGGGEAAAGAGMGSAVGGTAVATTAAAEEIGAAEKEIEVETSRLADFWAEQQAAMAADIEASKDEALVAWQEEGAALRVFQAQFAEAVASMEAAISEGTVVITDGVATQSAALEEGAATAAAASESNAAAAGGVGILGRAMGPLAVALGLGTAAYAAWDLVAGKTPDIVGQAAPAMDTLTEAIKENYGELNNNVQAIIDHNAATNGLLKGLEDAGISQADFNAAVQKGPEALDEISKTLGKYKDNISDTDFQQTALSKTFNVMGKTFDTHEDQLNYLKKSYDAYIEELEKTIKTSQAEVQATSELDAAQMAQAQSLGITAEEYASLLEQISDSNAKKLQATEQNYALLASDQNLQAILGLEETQYNSLTEAVLEHIHANQELNATLNGVQDLHTVFDPVLNAYKQWQDSIHAVDQAEADQVRTIQQGAQQVADAKKSEVKAEQAVVDAEKHGAESIKQAQESLASARQDAAEKIVQANDNVASAEQRVKDATLAVADAQKQANQQIVDATRFLRDQAETEQKARDDLLGAQLDASQKAHDAAQDALNNSAGLTQQQLIDTQNQLNDEQDKINADRQKIADDQTNYSIIDAQNKLNDLLADDVQKRKDAEEIIQEGVKNNPGVIKAQDDQKKAIQDVTKAKKDQAKAEKDAAKEIKDAEAAVTKARQDASKAIKDAIDKQKDSETALKTAEQNEMTANQQATAAVQSAKAAVDQNRSALTQLEIQTGQTDKSLGALQTTMKNMDKALTLRYQAKGVTAVGNATVQLQRSVEEVLLEAGGMDPAAARKKAISDNPAFGSSAHSSPPPVGTQSGGYKAIADGGAVTGPGGPRDDLIQAKLSNGEHVWTAAEVQAAGGHEVVKALRRAAVEGTAAAAFAAGGPVGGNANGPVIDAERMNIIDRLKHSGLLSVLGKGYEGDAKYADYLGSAAGFPNMAAVQAFIRAVDKLPYVFGAVGPDAYDCSGLVGEVWARLTGHPSYHRYFTTDNEANYFDPGPGVFAVGVTNHPGGTQHTAGRLGTLKFEARDSQEGIIVGPSALDPESFEHLYHLNPPGGGGGTAGVGNVGLSGHLTPDQAKAAAQKLMPAGWSWSALEALWTQESSWRWNADNADSGAYGIPQSLPANKMATAGADWHDNAVTQIKWGLDYIKSRYGNASAAEAHEKAYSWYDDGGLLPPGPSLTMNKTGKPEPVLTSDQWNQLLDGMKSGLSVEHLHLEIQADQIDDINKLVSLFKALPQTVRSSKAGTIRRVNA